MSYEKLEPHGRLTIASAEFAWDFYWQSSKGNYDSQGNYVVSPMLVEYQLIMMTQMTSGETRKRLLQSMRVKDNEDVNELMRWNLWVIDYYMREMGVSYGTKPRSFMIVSRPGTPQYKYEIMHWINHYRIRKSYHVVPSLVNAEAQANAIIRRLTGAYPKDTQLDPPMFMPGTFRQDTRAVIAMRLFYQLFLPMCEAPVEVSELSIEFWRTPLTNEPKQHEEKMGKVRVMKILKQLEHLEDEHCEMVGLDMYPANLTVYFMLPKDAFTPDGTMLNVNESLFALERKLSGKTLHEYLQKLLPQRTKRTKEILLSVPCFALKTEVELDQTLKNMGLGSLYDQKNGDWTNFVKDRKPEGGDFYLSLVKQIACVVLRQTSSVSNYYMKQGARMKKVPTDYTGRQVTLNRPFLFFVYDHFTRVILIIGRCQDPCDWRVPTLRQAKVGEKK